MLSPSQANHNPHLKARLAANALILGTFIKTPSPSVVEVLGRTGLDCLCLDAEHAPFDRTSLDVCVLAARSNAIHVLIRVPSSSPEHILTALDLGATGVLVPHIRSADEARAIVRAATYGPGGRGYAGSSRAADYTTLSMADHQRNSRERTVIIAQIEDPEAIEQIDSIAQVEGLDALFIGRADLTVAYGAESHNSPVVVAAMQRVCSAAKRHHRPVGLFVAQPSEVPEWQAQGASFFLVGSDHSLLISGAAAMLDQLKSPEPCKENRS